jgi:hypothetical protein
MDKTREIRNMTLCAIEIKIQTNNNEFIYARNLSKGEGEDALHVSLKRWKYVVYIFAT